MRSALVFLGIFILLATVFVVLLPFIFGLGGLSFDTAGLAPLRGGARGEDILLISRNGGEDWKEVIESEPDRLAIPSVVYDIKFHPRNPDIMYLGGKRGGLWLSENGGKDWERIGGDNSVLEQISDVYAIDVNRANPDILYLAVFQKNRGRILKSENGGLTFREVYFAPNDRIGIFGVFSDPDNPEKVYTVTGQGGFLDSQNGGRSWRVRKWFTEPLVKLIPNRLYPFEMYVVTSAGNVFKTFDRGENWADLSGDLSKYNGAKKFTTLAVDSLNFSNVYHGSSYGLLKSTNGGFTWNPAKVLIPAEALPVNAVAINPFNSKVIHMAASSQVYKSVDGGENWSIEQLPTKLKIKIIKIYPQNPEILYAVLGR